MVSSFDIQFRVTMDSEAHDDKEVVIFGCILWWKDTGVEWKADPKHRRVVLETFGFKKVPLLD